jgi:hypothetical protein
MEHDRRKDLIDAFVPCDQLLLQGPCLPIQMKVKAQLMEMPWIWRHHGSLF